MSHHRNASAGRFRRARDRRALGPLTAFLLASGLTGCFATADGPAILPEAREDVAFLIGAFEIGDGDAGDPQIESTVTRAGPGLVRFASTGGDWPVFYRTFFRALAGRCPADIAEGFDAAAEAVDEDPVEARAALDRLCDGTIEEICADHEFSFDHAPCSAIMARLRGPRTAAAPLPAQVAPSVEALAWLAEGLPHADDVLAATRPLDAMGAPGWALAEVKAIAGRGHFAGFDIFRPSLAAGDLLLLRAGSAGAVEVWATGDCLSPSDTPLPQETASQTLADCARRIARDADTPDGPRPWDMLLFTARR